MTRGFRQTYNSVWKIPDWTLAANLQQSGNLYHVGALARAAFGVARRMLDSRVHGGHALAGYPVEDPRGFWLHDLKVQREIERERERERERNGEIKRDRETKRDRSPTIWGLY